MPSKGSDSDHYAVDVLLDDIKWLGFQRLILKSDNEVAILTLLHSALTGQRRRCDAQINFWINVHALRAPLAGIC